MLNMSKRKQSTKYSSLEVRTKQRVKQMLLTLKKTVSSVLPSKRPADPDGWVDVNMKVKEACNEVDVTFVDNNANFTFRNGTADDSAFHRERLHLSESGIGRLLLNLSLPEQPARLYKRQHQQQRRHVSNGGTQCCIISAGNGDTKKNIIP